MGGWKCEEVSIGIEVVGIWYWQRRRERSGIRREKKAKNARESQFDCVETNGHVGMRSPTARASASGRAIVRAIIGGKIQYITSCLSP